MTRDVFLCDAVRTPIGRYGGALAWSAPTISPRIPIKRADGAQCRGRLGRSSTTCSTAAPTRPARTTATSRAWPRCSPACRDVPGTTVNRLCGSGLDAVGAAARAIRAGEADLLIAGGVESMTRAPFVMGKSDEAFCRAAPRSTTPPSAGASSTRR